MAESEKFCGLYFGRKISEQWSLDLKIVTGILASYPTSVAWRSAKLLHVTYERVSHPLFSVRRSLA